MPNFGLPCGGELGCKHPLPSCYCDSAMELEQRCAAQTDGVLWRPATCVQSCTEVSAWITTAWTNRHGAAADGKCARGHKHGWQLTRKEYRAVSEALRQPGLI